MKKLFALIFLAFIIRPSVSFGGCTETEAGVWEPDTLTYADTQVCLDDSGFDDGDTILLPSGTASAENWATCVKGTVGFIVKGAGYATEDYTQTVINDGTGSTFGCGAAFVANLSGSEYFELDSVTIIGPATNGDGTQGSVTVYSSSEDVTGDNFRIHHCKFDDLQDRGVKVDRVYGVIDNCVFEDVSTPLMSVQGVSVFGYGDDSWSSALSLGTANAVYIEDCTFNYNSVQDGALDAYDGARYVFRYNDVINTSWGHHGHDSGGYRSTFSFEIYNNTTTIAIPSVPKPFRARGGTGVIYDNIFATSGSGSYSIDDLLLVYYCACKDELNCDDPLSECTEYPCQDQPGRTTGQALWPVFEWDNTLDAADIDLVADTSAGCTNAYFPNGQEDVIAEDRDFYNDTEPSEKGYNYTAYTYPHPLTGYVAFLSAAINGSTAVITFSEDLDDTAFANLINGDLVFTGTTTGASDLESCSEDTGVVSCAADSEFIYGETVTLSSSGLTGDELCDEDENCIESISGEKVVNNTPAQTSNTPTYGDSGDGDGSDVLGGDGDFAEETDSGGSGGCFIHNLF